MLRPSVGQLGFRFLSSAVGKPTASKPARAPRQRPSTLPQLALDIDAGDHGVSLEPTVRGQARLETALRALIGPKVMLKLTDNTSTMVSFKRRSSVLYVRAHAMFADAPVPVIEALATFVARDKIPKRQSKLLDEWIERHRPALARRRAPKAMQPFGETHDLSTMFEQLNAHYFEGRITAKVTWSTARSEKRRRSIKMGSYCDDDKLIRIHPALDQAFVPTYVVEFVIYHEMLHQVHGILEDECGRRQMHTPQFRADEAKFEQFAKATRWEQRNLHRLLRY